MTDRAVEGLGVWPTLRAVAVDVDGEDAYTAILAPFPGVSDEFRAWDLAAGKPGGPPLEEAPSRADPQAVSPDGRWLLLTSDREAGVWDLRTGRKLGGRTFPGRVLASSFAPDGRTVATTIESLRLVVWDGQTGESRMPILSDVSGWHFSPDMGRLAVTHNNGLVRVWDFVAPPTRDRRVPNRLFFADQFVVDPGGRYWMTTNTRREGPDGKSASMATLWDGEAGEPVSPPIELGSGAGPPLAAFAPDGRLAAGVRGTGVRLWEVPSCRPVSEAPALPSAVEALAVRAGGVVVAVCGDGAIRTWDGAATWSTSCNHPGGVTAAALSPDGGRALTAGDAAVRLWDVASGAAISGDDGFWSTPQLVVSGAFSRDGSRAVVATLDLLAHVLDAGTGRPIGPPLAIGRAAYPPALSPDGRRLATAGRDGKILEYEVADGNLVSPPLWGPRPARDVSYHPNGEVLYVTGGESAPSSGASPVGVSVVDLLVPESLPAPELRRLVAVLAGFRVGEGGASQVRLGPDELVREWDELKARFPAEFRVDPDHVESWHLQELGRAAGGKDLFAARLHAEALLRSRPGDADLLEMKRVADETLGPR
ncbi:WD40 repeat domain-containing protein [Paludisphaera soli]|uniref:WD40 repeat domain-containing protein n=1 Tax=Paludisphaera soli TaxID=2712865 RepID=UPI0013EDA6B5|nr:PD40 domain-containing protein [Paludisphaera soli]